MRTRNGHTLLPIMKILQNKKHVFVSTRIMSLYPQMRMRYCIPLCRSDNTVNETTSI